MPTLWQDLRYGARMLLKQPGFTLIAVLTLALGIGANTAIFGIFSGVLLRPLPFPNAQQLLVAQGRPWLPVAHFMVWQAGQQSLTHLAAYNPREYHLTRQTETELIEGAEITPDFFPLLGVAPQVGRHLLAEEAQPGRERVALLSAGLWQRQFGAAQLERQTVRLNGEEYQVVGVLGKRKTIFGAFADNFIAVPYTSFERDFLWWKQGPDINIIVDSERHLDETRENVRATMRMRRKVPLNQPDDFAIVTAEAQLDFTKKVTDKVALALVVLASIALMVGGIGVMVIMLVSVTERTAEIGIRKAIGATRGQITWQFLIEAATLSGIGGLVGIFIGLGLAFIPSALIGFPYTMPIGWVMVAVIMSVSVGLFFGIFPARKAAKLDPIVALRHE